MTDIYHTLPNFDLSPFSNLIYSLEKNGIACVDLVTEEPSKLADRAKVPLSQLRLMVTAIEDALQADVLASLDDGKGAESVEVVERDKETRRDGTNQTSEFISMSDGGFDEVLGGGFPTGYVTEVTGESGSAKTQLLLTLLLNVQLPAPVGLGKTAIYISTEAPLSTTRLTQMLSQPGFSTLPQKSRPSLQNVLAIQTPDLEAQDHILRYQLPVAIERHNVGLVVIDSIAANFRAEFDNPSDGHQLGPLAPRKRKRSPGLAMADRRVQLIQLGHLLRQTATKYNIAIVVANQVADRFLTTSVPNPRPHPENGNGGSAVPTQNPKDERPSPPEPAESIHSPDELTLDHQMKWFTGWGDIPASNPSSLKTPALGLVWANQIAGRITLIRGSESADGQTMRKMRMVFAAWAKATEGEGREFAVTAGGLRSVVEG